MSTPRTQAYARVKLEIEIAVNDTWGPDCKIDQVHKQATESAYGILRQLFEKTKEQRITVRGEPVVSAIIVEKSS